MSSLVCLTCLQVMRRTPVFLLTSDASHACILTHSITHQPSRAPTCFAPTRSLPYSLHTHPCPSPCRRSICIPSSSFHLYRLLNLLQSVLIEWLATQLTSSSPSSPQPCPASLPRHQLPSSWLRGRTKSTGQPLPPPHQPPRPPHPRPFSV